MSEISSLASRLSDAADLATAAEALGEHLLTELPGAAVRVWVVGSGDRCATCAHVRTCETRERCLHLEASLGEFTLPPGAVERLPLTHSLWVGRQDDSALPAPRGVPATVEGAEDETHLTVLPLEAGGERLGVAAMRTAYPIPDGPREGLVGASLVVAAALRHLATERRDGDRRAQLRLLNGLARKVGTILDDELLIRQVVQDVHRTFGFHNVMVFLRDGKAGGWRLRGQAAAVEHPSLVGRRVDADVGIIGRAARERKTIVVDDVETDPDFVPWFEETLSELAVPLLIGSRVEGVLNVESDSRSAFGPSERSVLETVSNQLAIALENARLFQMVKEREDRYRRLVEFNPGAVLHLDRSGRIVFQNPAARILTGRPDHEVPSDLDAFASIVTVEDRPALANAVQKSMAGDPQLDLELGILHADGTPRWIQASFQPLMGDDGSPHGVVVLARDRSRERELQDRLYQSEKLGAIGALVSGVAHELNNPLAGILGYAQLLISSPADEWGLSDLEKIEHNAKRCQGIVESLLQFARAAKLRKRPAVLNEVIESVLRLNEYQMRMDKVEVEKSYDPRVPAIPLDVNRWQQVIINLASNAQQAIMQAASEERRIRFETRTEGGEIVLRVEDSGPGVPAPLRSRIFEPFYTTKETGTGLGLSICYGIVRDHGGTIELDASSRKGTHFVIRLPVPDEVRPMIEDEVPPESKATAAHGSGRILLLDDEPAVRDVVRTWLERHGYEVECFEDPKSALDRATTRAFRAVVADVALPGDMDGLMFYDALRDKRPDLAERLIFVTGYGFHEDLAAGLERRRRPCLHKPFDLHELLRLITEVGQGVGPGAGSPVPT